MLTSETLDHVAIDPDDRSWPNSYRAGEGTGRNTLLGWYHDDADVQARLPLLSTYLGHTDPRHTYWYLSAAHRNCWPWLPTG